MKSFPKAFGAGLTTRSDFPLRRSAGAVVAAGCAGMLPFIFPSIERGFFSRGTAVLAGLFTGAPVIEVDAGWLLGVANSPVVITDACSATDYFMITALLIAWHLSAPGRSVVVGSLSALVLALPLTLGVNAFRIVVVSQLHHWTSSSVPSSYGHFVHLLIGVAVFLPSLIALNLLLEIYGKSRVPVDHEA